jgi:hypothetical protein
MRALTAILIVLQTVLVSVVVYLGINSAIDQIMAASLLVAVIAVPLCIGFLVSIANRNGMAIEKAIYTESDKSFSDFVTKMENLGFTISVVWTNRFNRRTLHLCVFTIGGDASLARVLVMGPTIVVEKV